MRRSTRGALAAVVVLGTTVAGALPATAQDKPVVTVEKNTRLDLVIDKGQACSFTTKIHGEGDIKTLKYKHKTVTIFTHSFARITNPANKKSVRFTTNVTFVDKELSNGGLASSSRGKAVIWGPHVGFSPDAGPAFLYVQGKATWTTVSAADGGPIVFHTIKGQVTNICTLIA
jgi:hypothetical protein